MKFSLFLALSSLSVVALAACAPGSVPGSVPVSAPVEKTIYVGPELVDCEGVAPQKCLQVKEDPNAEYSLYYGTIEGFEYAPGSEYELTVREETVENPPADSPTTRWILVNVVSSNPVASSPGTSDLESGQLWSLKTYVNASGEQVSVLAGSEITLKLEAGNLGGNAGCNNYFGSYTISGDQVTVSGVGSTMMFCSEPEGVMDQETAYLAALGKAAGFQVSADQLTITDSAGDPILVFAPLESASLAGTNWSVVNYNNGKDALVSALLDTQITALFGEDGTVSGTASCNNYSGPYTVDGQSIQIGPLVSTMMACADPEGIMEQETAYLAALEQATTYQIEGDMLTLMDDAGQKLVIYQSAE